MDNINNELNEKLKDAWTKDEIVFGGLEPEDLIPSSERMKKIIKNADVSITAALSNVENKLKEIIKDSETKKTETEDIKKQLEYYKELEIKKWENFVKQVDYKTAFKNKYNDIIVSCENIIFNNIKGVGPIAYIPECMEQFFETLVAILRENMQLRYNEPVEDFQLEGRAKPLHRITKEDLPTSVAPVPSECSRLEIKKEPSKSKFQKLFEIPWTQPTVEEKPNQE